VILGGEGIGHTVGGGAAIYDYARGCCDESEPRTRRGENYRHPDSAVRR